MEEAAALIKTFPLWIDLSKKFFLRAILKVKKRNIPFFLWRSSKAFSLIEILVVLFIIAFLFTLAIQSVVRKDKKIKNAFHKLIRLNNRLVTVSKLYNKEYRLVMQLNKEGPEQYWVEKKQPKIIQKSRTDKDPNASPFFIDESFYPKPQALPPLLQIIKVESSSWKTEKTEGLVYIYYYPKGLAQETSIYFFRPDNRAEWTLYLDPVTKNFQVIQ